MEAPKTIARYRLTGELGRGGMGVVYRAEDPQLGRPVAIKVILFPLDATDEFRAQLEKRFEREARSAASIHHPGVVTVHDFGRDGDYLYLVMELVAGESLADRLKTGWLPERTEAFEIAAQVADGLAAAHAAGVVHRDVTPRNILMARDGRVVVTDFGIARSIGEETYELTRTGMLVGSPSFMAPEQVRNKNFDARADLFALGVVLYLLLTGKLPFRSQDLTSLLYQIVHEDPFESSQVTGKLGLGTVQFLQKCLAKDSADRVQKASDFAREARRLMAAAQTSELEETVALDALVRDGAGRKRAGKNGGGQRALIGLALIAAMVAGAWSLYSLFGSGRRDPGGGTTVALTREATPPTTDTPTPSRLDGPRATAKASPGEDSPGIIPEGDPELRPTDAITALPVAPVEENLPEAPDSATDDEPQPGRETETATPTPPRPAPAPVATTPDRKPTGSQPLVAEPTKVALEPTLDASQALPPPTTTDTESKYTMPADTVPPVLDIDDMPRGLTATEVVLSGRVMDDRGGAVELTVDGEQVPVEADGGFIARRPLSPGRNSLAFVAVDAAGNPTMKSVDVTAATNAVSPESGGVVQAAQQTRPQAVGPAQPRARPRFADRGDGTLIDTLTAITWTKRVEKSSGWKASKSHCKKLEMGRHRDWMLPTIEELEELYRSGTGIMTFPPGLIWSSTRNGSAKAWAFDFIQGQRNSQSLDGAEGTEFKAFCLRRERARTPEQGLGESPFGTIDGLNSGAGGQPPGGGGRDGGGRGGGGGGGQGGGGGRGGGG